MKHLKTRSRFTFAMIGLTALVALLLPASAQGELLDDFSDGDEIGWTRFTFPPNLPGASWDASTGIYLLWVEDWAPAGGSVCSFLDITNDPEFWHGYWSATVVRKTENSTTHLFMRGEFATMNAYGFGWAPGLGLVIQLVEGGVGTLLANDETFVQDVGTKYILEAGAFDSRLELRMWPIDEARPELPQLAVTDSAYAYGANGIISQAYSDGDLAGSFDDVCFATEPSGIADFSIEDRIGLIAAPNPSPGRIQFRIPTAADGSGQPRLSIYDAQGRLISSSRQQGLRSEFTWHGRTQTGQLAPSGVYYAVLRAGTRTDCATIQLVR